MKRLLLIVLLFSSAIAAGQNCSSDPSGKGSRCPAPFAVIPSPSDSPTSTWTITPADSQHPCPFGATSAAWVICGQNGAITVDFGDGKGYQTMKGGTGDKGDKGDKGDAATILIGYTSTLAPGSDATVSNKGDSHNAIFDFGIPAGQSGRDGITPQVSVGTTRTIDPGSQATVSNSGQPPNVILNFGIPQGQPGQPGKDGKNGLLCTKTNTCTITCQTVNLRTGARGCTITQP